MEEELNTHPLAIMTNLEGAGMEIFHQLVHSGHDILINTQSPLPQAIEIFARKASINIYSSTADLSSYRGVEEFVSEVRALGLIINVIVISPRMEHPAEDNLWDQFALIRSNTLAIVHLLHRIKNEMFSRGQGKIIFTHARDNAPLGIQDASQSFLVKYGKSLKNELQGMGIEVVISEEELEQRMPLKHKIQSWADKYLHQLLN